MKIKVVNPDKEIELVIKDLERGNEAVARSRLSNIKKRERERLRYAEKKFEREQPSGMDYQIQKATIKQLKIDYNILSDSIDTIHSYMKNPESFSYKENRAEYFRLQRSFQRVSILGQKKEAEKETLRKAQSEKGDVVGITISSIRKSDKVKALLQNVIYNNPMFNFNESELQEVSKAIKDITGYDLMQDIVNIFNTPSHYESEGGSGNEPIYDSIKNITNKLENAKKSYSDEELKILEENINKFKVMARD